MTARTLRKVTALVALAAATSACGTISVEEEKEIGAQIQAQRRKEMTFVRDPVCVNYIRQFGAQLAASARPSPFEFRFYLVEDEAINADAIPGGAVYIRTGLLLAVKNGAELAGVMSHEMGHVTARHVAKNINKAKGTSFVANVFALAVAIVTGNPYLGNLGGVGAGVAGQAFMTTFSRDAERQADALGVETMTNAGWNPEGMVTLFETLKKEYGSGGGVQFLATHPATDERIQNVRNEIKKYPGSDQLKFDDPRLPIIQERLKLILGTDREKEDKSDGSEDHDRSDDSD
ncbi:MAG TPA: M48 family metallopeptidase [Myxococcota bacterium]|nr:M48 family metallopeptidase [Myxococcota bacterium]